MVMREVFRVIRESKEMLTPAVMLIHGQVISKTTYVVFIPAEVATFFANSTRNIKELTTLSGRKIRVSYLTRTKTHKRRNYKPL